MKRSYCFNLSIFDIWVLQQMCKLHPSKQGPKESVGALSGMVIGGALANDMAGDSRNKSIATVLGAFVGGVIGQNIGAQLDERDRLLAGEAYKLLWNIMQRIKLRNGETLILEIMVVLYRSQHIVKTVDTAENLRKRFSLVAKNRRVMVEPVDSQMDLGK
jgi:hypothetical protein